MVASGVPKRGDVYWIDPNPVAGREIRDRHRFVVISPEAVNALGVSMTVPVTTGGDFIRKRGLAVPITGHQTTGVAICNEVRSFDIRARLAQKTAGFVERLDEDTVFEIVARVVSCLDPEPEG